MEKTMPRRLELNLFRTQVLTHSPTSEVVRPERREKLPVLTGANVVLRELRPSDAESLFAMIAAQEVARFISPPPTTVEGFERFIAWTQTEPAAGNYICFAVTLKGFDTAIGLFQVRLGDHGLGTAEWGFALGTPFWGTGVFQESAELVLEFVFETLAVHRLEARAAMRNGRGNGALLKLGAVQEARLRRSFLRDGQLLDQMLYTIIDDDWRSLRKVAARRPTFAHVH